MLGLCLSLFITTTTVYASSAYKQTSLNARLQSNDGVSLSANPISTTISGSSYHINVVSQSHDYDLKVSMNNSWGFQSASPSTITLVVDGSTPYPSADLDLLVVFAIADLQYFSFFIHLDALHRIKSRIYYDLSSSNTTIPVSEWISSDAIYTRFDRISNNGNWTLLPWNKQATWPLTFVLTNDPSNDQSIFRFYHNTSHSYATGYIFPSSFMPNANMDVYILGDDNTERYEISALDVSLTHNDDSALSGNRSTLYPQSDSAQQRSYQILTSLKFGESTNYTAKNVFRHVQETMVAYLSMNQSVLCSPSSLSLNKPKLDTLDSKSARIVYVEISGIMTVCSQMDIAQSQQELVQRLYSVMFVYDVSVKIFSSVPNVSSTVTVNTKLFDDDTDLEGREEDVVLFHVGTNEDKKAKILMWMIQLITGQLILCCFLILCILVIKIRTFKLRLQQEEICEIYKNVQIFHEDADGEITAVDDEDEEEQFVRDGTGDPHQQQHTLPLQVHHSGHSRPRMKHSTLSKSNQSNKSNLSNVSKKSKSKSKSKSSRSTGKTTSSKSVSKSKGSSTNKKSKLDLFKKPLQFIAVNSNTLSKGSKAQTGCDELEDAYDDEADNDLVVIDRAMYKQTSHNSTEDELYDEPSMHGTSMPTLQGNVLSEKEFQNALQHISLKHTSSNKRQPLAMTKEAAMPQSHPVFPGGQRRNASVMSIEPHDDVFEEPSCRHSDDNLLADIDESVECEVDQRPMPPMRSQDTLPIAGQQSATSDNSDAASYCNTQDQPGANCTNQVVRGNTIYSDHSRYPSLPQDNKRHTKKLTSLFSPNDNRGRNHVVSPTLTFSLPRYLRKNAHIV